MDDGRVDGEGVEGAGGGEIRMVRSFSSIVLQQAKVRSITICMY